MTEKLSFDVSANLEGNAVDFLVLSKFIEPKMIAQGKAIGAQTNIFYKLDGTYISLENITPDSHGYFKVIANYYFENPVYRRTKYEKILSSFASINKLEKENF